MQNSEENRQIDIESLSLEEIKTRYKEILDQLDEYRALKGQTWSQVSTILSSIPLGLVIVNPAGKIEATNQQLRQIFGFDAKQLYDQPISTLFPDLEDLNSNELPEKIAGKNKNGQMIPVEISVNVIDTSDGLRHCVHVKDISEKQRMFEYKMNLASMVSHDLRTPLTTMRAVLSSINGGMYGNLSKDGSDAVNWALVSSDYMNTILSNILDAERIDSTELKIQPQETTTGKVVTSAVDLCKLYADEFGIEIVTDITNDTFYADHARIVRILVNLLSNAIKFSTKGDVVKVEGGLEGIDVVFRVNDKGPGIPEDLQPVIFDRFQQLNKNIGGRKSGFGLGLSISKAFAKMHGGDIKLFSQPGKGSTFELSIPLVDSSSK